MKQFDFTIIGGGMVGSAAAVGLAKLGYKVAVVESAVPKPFAASQSVDLRVSAISKGSVDLLEQLGAWQGVMSRRACPYRRLATWEAEECRIEFSANELELDWLGYMVENRVIQLALMEQFDDYPEITLFADERMRHFSQDAEGVTVVLESGMELRSRTLIGADGSNSQVRQQAKIGVTAWDYRQHCMLIHVETELPQQDITWQWFTPTGPRSFLPLSGNQASLVWYDSPKTIAQLSAMNNEQLTEQVMAAFPSELGEIKVLSKGSFPLTRRHAQQYAANKVVLLGDSAHTINPLAGQGVNLGFKDVAALIDMVKSEGNCEQALTRYERIRTPDNLLMQSSMDLFYKGFSNDIAPLKFARNAALKLADKSGVLKKQALKYALGL